MVRALAEVDVPEFVNLKADIESHPRLSGYYIVGLVSVRDLRADAVSQEAILETVIEHFDDDPGEPPPGFVPDHQWSDYETTHEKARTHTVDALVGGGRIGHTSETMNQSTAGELFDRFVALCGDNPRFYTGLGIGDPEYPYLYGVLIVAEDLAGILWIVESD